MAKDQKFYQGKPAVDVKPVKEGDHGYNQNKDQVSIDLGDGSRKVIDRSELSDS